VEDMPHLLLGALWEHREDNRTLMGGILTEGVFRWV
jgi:hypothetical protein